MNSFRVHCDSPKLVLDTYLSNDCRNFPRNGLISTISSESRINICGFGWADRSGVGGFLGGGKH